MLNVGGAVVAVAIGGWRRIDVGEGGWMDVVVGGELIMEKHVG